MLSVLVIGPESLSGELGPTVLGRPDVERTHADDPASALADAERVRATLVVVDLPPSEAATMVRQLRGHEPIRDCAIVCTVRGGGADEEAVLRAAGANEVVPVPIEPSLWDRRLEELLSVPARRARLIAARLSDWSRAADCAFELDALVLNIGVRGALVESARDLPIGATVGLGFQLPGDEQDLAVVGQVVRRAQDEEGRFRAGIEFLAFRGDARERISRFVLSDDGQLRSGAPGGLAPAVARTRGDSREWEEEIRASDVRKAMIIDSSPEAILTMNQEGRVIEFNAAARRLTGFTRSELLGRDAAETLLAPSDRAAFRRVFQALAAEGELPDLGRPREMSLLRADGTPVPVEVVAVPAYVKGSLLLTMYARDVTERQRRKRLAAARHRATRALTAALSLEEAAPAVLDALVSGLACDDARLWLLDGSDALTLAAVSPAGATGRNEAEEGLARGAIETSGATWQLTSPGRPGAALAVPMRSGGQSLGALEVRAARLEGRDEEWSELVCDVAGELCVFLERQRAEEELQRFARYDGLTGLPNRSFFRETLDRSIARAARQNGRLALVFLDLDGFKGVNDELGHAAGDEVLRTMAERLRGGTRTADVTARVGGDEFVVLVQSLAQPGDAARVARGLVDRLATPCSFDGRELKLGASAGIAVYPEDGLDAETLLGHADMAMYRAKQEGGNSFRFFTAEMSERAAARRAWAGSVARLLEANELELEYQPVVDAGRPLALEALVRWPPLQHGTCRAMELLAEAEDAGLASKLAGTVIRKATRFMAPLGCGGVRLAVNLSRRQLLEPHLFETVRQALETSGLGAERLELDLGEAALVAADQDPTPVLQRLRALGVRLAADGFGAGAFSVARLRALGIATVKIDRSLVTPLPDSIDHALQLEALLALARALSLEVVAEGVETEAQRRLLESYGCTALQGPLVARPLAAHEVPAFLAPDGLA